MPKTYTATLAKTAKAVSSRRAKNNAGGTVFSVDEWTQLQRFLVLGTEGGSYYVKESKLTAENADIVRRCVKENGQRTVDAIVAVSSAGRAPKNDPAILALAIAADVGDAATRIYAYAHLQDVCRTGTHLLHFCAFSNELRGWGRGLRSAVGKWYMQDAKHVAYQAVKYRQRDAWTQRDALRLSHPIPPTEQHKIIYNWITKGWPDVGVDVHPEQAAQIIWAYEQAQRADTAAAVAKLITDYQLPRETIPTKWLVDPLVWEALLQDMPATALIRNLATMTKIGLLQKNSQATQRVVEMIGNTEKLRRARVHPIALLSALKVYEQGHGERSDATWSPVSTIVDALDSAFYAAFAAVEPSNKRLLLGIDVSGSMYGNPVSGIAGLDAATAAAAMALVTASTEPHASIMAFSHEFVPLNITPNERLDSVIRKMQAIPMGATDCSLPMRYAQEEKLLVDGFVVLTDSESYYGNITPVQALAKYRQASGIQARLAVQAFVASSFTIADPKDIGTMDIIGLDAATPAIVSDFLAGRV